MAVLSGIAEIKCDKCGKSFSIDASDLDVDQVGVDERQMGRKYFMSAKLSCNAQRVEMKLR